MTDKNSKLWGGRFAKGQSKITEELSASIHYDRRLYQQDIRGSRAHAKMLKKIGVLSNDELKAILAGLSGIEQEIEAGTFEFSAALEDIHMNIESALTLRIGEAGRKLHTGRSRNDQVALDTRLYIRDEAVEIEELLIGLIAEIVRLAEAEKGTIMPGYTHLQVAQPVRFSHHILAYAWKLIRDRTRLRAAGEASSLLPLGSGALAGLNYPTDREFLRKELGFKGITQNSMDSVSDRDFVLDFLYFAALLGTHLSRFCEDIVLWSSAEFRFISLSDEVTTGSSIMPQKRNPDIAELVRGKSGRLYGNLVALFVTLKGLPMTYNRDLQEDKEGLFDSVDTVKLTLAGTREMIAGMRVNRERMLSAVTAGFSTATDLADYLAQKGLPFREAHSVIGNIVRYCEEQDINFFSLGTDDLKRFSPLFEDDALLSLNPKTSPERKLSPGSTSLSEVEKQIEALKGLV